MGYAVNAGSPKNYMPAVVRKVAVHHRICMVHALNEGDLDRHLTVWVDCWAWLEPLNWGISGHGEQAIVRTLSVIPQTIQ